MNSLTASMDMEVSARLKRKLSDIESDPLTTLLIDTKVSKLKKSRMARRCETEIKDCILRARGGQEIRTNWNMLNSIPYFKALHSFTNQSEESHTVDLEDFPVEMIRLMLSHLTAGKCEIEQRSLAGLLQLADFLQIDSLIKFCMVSLHSYLLMQKISPQEAHDLLQRHQLGIDRVLQYNICDVAVELGYIPLVREGLAIGVNPNIVYEDLRNTKTGHNLLFKAIIHGHSDVVRVLLESGANVNYQKVAATGSQLLDANDTPWIENFHALRQRYQPSGSIDYYSPARGTTALHIAVWRNRLDIVKLLIEQGARIQPDQDGETPIHIAVAYGYLDILKYFVQQVYQCLFNAHTNIMGTPLFRAVLSGNLDIVKLMIQHGADVYQTDYTGFSIISYAAVSNQLHMVTYLHRALGLDLGEQNDTLETCLHQCASLGHLEIIRYAVEQEPKLLSVQDERGDTPLHVAVLYDQMQTAKLLIEANSQVNLPNYLNEHPLHVALMENCTEIIPSLLRAGANPNAILNIRDTATPLSLAIMCGGDMTLTYVKLLLEAGADPKLLHNKALILALKENIHQKDEIVSLLLRYGGDPNARCLGSPVLMDVAAISQSSHLVKLLLDHGANVNAINRQGQTALMVACAKEHTDTVEILLKHGADSRMKSWYGMSAHMLIQDSASGSSQNITTLLRDYDNPTLSYVLSSNQ